MPWLFLSRAIIIKPTEKPRTPSKAKFAVKIRLWEHCKQNFIRAWILSKGIGASFPEFSTHDAQQLPVEISWRAEVQIERDWAPIRGHGVLADS